MICILFYEKIGQDESSIGFDLKDSVIMHVFWQNDVDFTECSSNPFHIFWFVYSSHRPGFFVLHQTCLTPHIHPCKSFSCWSWSCGTVITKLMSKCLLNVYDGVISYKTLYCKCMLLYRPDITSPVLLIKKNLCSM